MAVKLEKNNGVWFIFYENQIIGELHLDFLCQLDKVLIYQEASERAVNAVLHRAMFHAKNYLKQRLTSAWGGILLPKQVAKDVTPADSDRIMLSQAIPPELEQVGKASAIHALAALNIDVITTVHKNYELGIRDAISETGVSGLTYEQIHGNRVNLDTEITVRFSVNQPHCFMYWNSLSQPLCDDTDRYIIAAYHPVMNNGRLAGKINGENEVYIRGNAVRYIYCPKEARSAQSKRLLGSSWSFVKHPYCATGQTVEMGLVTTFVRSKEGIAELAHVLKASLGHENKYISVSQGFRPPFRLITTSPRTSRRLHGSESSCAWQYLILEHEGVLEKSYVPEWFTNEQWPKK